MGMIELFPRGEEGGEEGRALPENVPFLSSVAHISFIPPLGSFLRFISTWRNGKKAPV